MPGPANTTVRDGGMLVRILGGDAMTEHGGYNASIIAEFRANHGQVGGNFAGAPLLLLHTTGARTGTPRVNPVMYLPDDGRYLVFATKAGAHDNPAWYHNLLAHPDTTIEVGDRVIEVHADELGRRERDEKYAEQARRYPGFAGYERKTARVIPVIALTPVGGAQKGN
jgi:deazaflavin-dependent oxidoreductase (nitroreductase family)